MVRPGARQRTRAGWNMAGMGQKPGEMNQTGYPSSYLHPGIRQGYPSLVSTVVVYYQTKYDIFFIF